MVVLIACKNDNDQINNGHKIKCRFFRRSRADNSALSRGIWPKFDLIKAFMHVVDTCKNEEDPVKMQ